MFQRCAVDAVDQQGATALHVTAERGGVEVCWILLQRTGCGMLHQKNHSGLTPLDLSKQGKTFRWICCFQKYVTPPPPHKTRRMLHFILASFGTYEISSMFAFPDSIFLLGLWCWLLLCCIFSLDISNSPNYWVGTLMSQYTTSPESLMVHLALYMSSIHSFYNKNTKIIIAKQFMLQLFNWISLDVLCWMWSYKQVKGCFVFFFLNSYILLDTVFSIAEWSCHPADCSHVGRLWGFNLWFALPMACQKHFHTIPPHDHIPKVWQKL